MSWETLFIFTNGIALVGWTMLAFLPRRPIVMAGVLFFCVGLLCMTYTAMFIALFAGLADPARVAGAPPADIMNYTLPGLRALFMSDGGIVLGWTHYLAFDLFIGQWIARDADTKGFNRLIQIPFLFVTLMAGPIGLLLWLFVRESRARTVSRQMAS